jgi:hypothetical protein
MLELHDERRVLIPLSLIRTLESMDADEHLVEGVFDPTNDFVRGSVVESLLITMGWRFGVRKLGMTMTCQWFGRIRFPHLGRGS